MTSIKVPTRDQVPPASQLLFDVLQKRMGKVPNLYAALVHSPYALQSFMTLDETLSKGVFNQYKRKLLD